MLPSNNPDRVQQLQKACRYSTWHNRNRLDGSLFVWRFAFTGSEFPSWKPVRSQTLVTPFGVTQQKSVWIPEATSPLHSFPRTGAGRAPDPSAPLVHADAFECASRAAAHEFLVELFGEFQVPGVTLNEGCAAGDVAFSAPGAQVMLIARANLVFLIRSAGRAPVPIADLVLALDQGVLMPPENFRVASRAVSDSAASAAAPSLRINRGGAVPLPIAPSDAVAPSGSDAVARAVAAEAVPSPAPGPTLKVFANLGEVSLDRDRLVYLPIKPGRDEVRVFGSDRDGRPTLQSIPIEVS
jgi:hypothetical protein